MGLALYNKHKTKIMIQGITIEKATGSKSRFVKIDLDKYRNSESLNLFLKENGVEVEESVKWTKKMLESFKQAENGEIYEVDINNFWND